MEKISWKFIDKYFAENTHNLVAHHLDSYNDFFATGINNIFKENNPLRFIERNEENTNSNNNQILLYLGGKDGNKIYFGKPIIYDENYSHYMYPNDARLRNMTYGLSIHYDVDVEVITYDEDDNEKKNISTLELQKIYLGNFPIMVQSNLCILNGLHKEVRFNMGECRNDYGGYFIINGKEKSIICQEKFADNMLYVRKHAADDDYSFSADIRSVSDDASKPIRTTSIRMVAPSSTLTNNQIVINVPNVRKPVPLFILMRALGVLSDKNIIEFCLLNLEKNAAYVDLFIPSVHDAFEIYNQKNAIEYIASFTKRKTIAGTLDILMNYFLPHVGTDNFIEKAYYIGYMVNKLLRVFTGDSKPTDRDNFKFKRVELTGTLIYELFREWYLIQKKHIEQVMDKEYYYHSGKYAPNLSRLIEDNYATFFKERIVEGGFKKGFKGNWGSEEHTKRVGVIQDVNRLSWISFMEQLRKFNLPFPASAKIVEPRKLNPSQWGYIDPVDTPDGENIGFHKHMAIMCTVSNHFSYKDILSWLQQNSGLIPLTSSSPIAISSMTKILLNGRFIGIIENPLALVRRIKLNRRNGIFPIYTSVAFHYELNEIYIFTDAGRLCRPIYYIDEETGKPSFDRKESNAADLTWQQIITGLEPKDDLSYNIKKNKVYLNPEELYKKHGEKLLKEKQCIIDYIDTSEAEGTLIATTEEDLIKNKYYTHIEIHPSLILGFLCNFTIYPEHNPLPRNSFSCGQSKQAVSMYHSNYQMRMDKMGVIMNYGQTPLVKSRYMKFVNNEEMPYGVNTIVAIMSYTGYNVEDAVLINRGSIERGLFRTTYYTTYTDKEESSKVKGSTSNTKFSNIEKLRMTKLKIGYDYSYLDEYGLVKEGTQINDKIVVIGKVTSDSMNSEIHSDESVTTKKGQLGFVDKSFITEGEEGFRVSKVRVCEVRLPAIGDKMASRAGQKGTIGLIIDEKDMPFTADGLKPDIIINPHALPSRMTIGHLIECLLGNAGVHFGAYGDCTPFTTKGSNAETYGQVLSNAGLNSKGLKILYDGMSGAQMDAEIFFGPTYYMRLKHMVKDKVNYRATGPRTMLTKQTVQGRANDGGMRIGEMERDGILAHGASAFLNESYLKRGDEYFMAVCNKTGGLAVYNKNANIFLSPFADGPIQFNTNLNGSMNVENISRFGRSFSIVRVPYALKLMIQELQAMNVQLRIITEDNIDQILNMSYSTNAQKLLKIPETTSTSNTFKIFKETTDAALMREEPIEAPTPTTNTNTANNNTATFENIGELEPSDGPSLTVVDNELNYPSPEQYIQKQKQMQEQRETILSSPYTDKGMNELKNDISLFLSPEEVKSVMTNKTMKRSKWTSLTRPQQESVKQYIHELKTNVLSIPEEKQEGEDGGDGEDGQGEKENSGSGIGSGNKKIIIS